MLEETIRLNQTIDGLLLLARAEMGQADEQRTAFSLPALIKEILALLEVLLEDRHIAVLVEGEEKMTESLMADRSLIRVAVLNALHNAIKFTAYGSPLRISYAHLERDGRHFQQVCIHDSGPGILPGEHNRIFDRFFTSRSPQTSASSGSGLGLSISKLIIERSGGRIYFDESHSDPGARCCIELPIST